MSRVPWNKKTHLVAFVNAWVVDLRTNGARPWQPQDYIMFDPKNKTKYAPERLAIMKLYEDLPGSRALADSIAPEFMDEFRERARRGEDPLIEMGFPEFRAIAEGIPFRGCICGNDRAREVLLLAIVSAIGRECASCKARARKLARCGRCRKVLYCGIECQRAHWTSHRNECRK